MARIFIAIRFNDEFKQKLVAIQGALKSRGVRGNYCSYGNLHLTLAFIGESYDLPAIRNAVKEVQFEPFDLTLDKLGSFPTKAGETTFSFLFSFCLKYEVACLARFHLSCSEVRRIPLR